MKKIISAALVASVAAGLATAEISVGLNYRRGTNVFSDANLSKSTATFMKFGDVTGTDAFTFKASNDYAGITLNYNPTSAPSGDKNPAKNFWAGGNGVEYTAYVNPTSWLQLKGGVHKDGITYAEQVKKDTDDTNWSAAGKYAFLYKLGLTAADSTGIFLDDMTSINGAGAPFAFADFKFNGVGPGNLLVRASLAGTYDGSGTTPYNWLKKGGYNDKTVYAAPGLVVGYKINDLVDVNVDVQMASNNDLAFGLYASPLGLLDGNLTGTLGFTMSTVLDGEKDAVGARVNNKDGVTFFGIDLRFRYVAGDFHIANAFNFTGASEDKQVKQKQTTASARTGNSNIWDSVFLTYKLTDNWTITGNVQLQAALGVGTGDETILDLAVTPGVMYTVGKGATITAGLYTTFNDLTDKLNSNSIGVALPVIFRVKM